MEKENKDGKVNNGSDVNSDKMSLTNKMTKLKLSFINEEISAEEFEIKKKELLAVNKADSFLQKPEVNSERSGEPVKNVSNESSKAADNGDEELDVAHDDEAEDEEEHTNISELEDEEETAHDDSSEDESSNKHPSKSEHKHKHGSKHQHKIVPSKSSDDGNINAWAYVTVALAIFLLISLAVNAGFFNGGAQGNSNKPAQQQNPDKQVVADKAVNYINSNILSSGSKATLSGIEEKSGVYDLKLTIDGKSFNAYISKDGTLLFPSVFEIANKPAAQANAAANAPQKPQAANTAGVDVSVDDDPSIGPSDAPVTIVEFSDYQCPFCARAEPALKQVLETYSGKVRLVYRDFPLSFHPYAKKAAEASECADEQGKFWEYHDLLFEKQSEWSSAGESKFKDYATQLGLDTAKFNTCLDTGKYASEVESDFAEGQKYGVSGTPAFFVNGKLISGAQPFSSFKAVIDAELAK